MSPGPTFQDIFADDPGDGPGSGSGSGPGNAQRVGQDDAETRELVHQTGLAGLQRLKDETALRKGYALYAAILVGAQVLIADGAFIAYGRTNDWDVPAEVMLGWLGGTVVEVIGVMLVITRSLFPSKHEKPPPG